MAHGLSSLRLELRSLQQQLQSLLECFFGREPLLPGSLYTLRRRCGKPNCRCARGELHDSTVLSYRGRGKPQSVTPPPDRLDDLRKLTDDYRRFRQARTQLARLQRQMLSLVDRMEALRVEQGERRFREIRGGSRPSSRR